MYNLNYFPFRLLIVVKAVFVTYKGQIVTASVNGRLERVRVERVAVIRSSTSNVHPCVSKKCSKLFYARTYARQRVNPKKGLEL